MCSHLMEVQYFAKYDVYRKSRTDTLNHIPHSGGTVQTAIGVIVNKWMHYICKYKLQIHTCLIALVLFSITSLVVGTKFIELEPIIIEHSYSGSEIE